MRQWLILVAHLVVTIIKVATRVPRRADLRHFVWRSDCAGLFHTPIAA
jgi:hypothetical protein